MAIFKSCPPTNTFISCPVLQKPAELHSLIKTKFPVLKSNWLRDLRSTLQSKGNFLKIFWKLHYFLTGVTERWIHFQHYVWAENVRDILIYNFLRKAEKEGDFYRKGRAGHLLCLECGCLLAPAKIKKKKCSPIGRVVQSLLTGLGNFRAIRKTNNNEISDSEQPRSALMESPNTLPGVSWVCWKGLRAPWRGFLHCHRPSP